jgi:hypothetical protein
MSLSLSIILKQYIILKVNNTQVVILLLTKTESHLSDFSHKVWVRLFGHYMRESTLNFAMNKNIVLLM